MVKISVVSPTIREPGLNIVKRALENQTFDDFEWLVGSPFVLKKNYTKLPFKWIEDDFEFGHWTLNRMYNKLFKNCEGELIVTLQDWIWVEPDGLQKFWDNYEKTKGIISGVGDQYEKEGKYGKPEIKIWSDPRKTDKYGSFYECMPNDVEWNWAAIPKAAIYAVGGMDEQLDFEGFGGDQLQIGERMDALGWRSFLDQTNESFTIRHDRKDYGGQQEWDDNHVLFNGKYLKRRQFLIESGQWPVLPYLNSEDKNDSV